MSARDQIRRQAESQGWSVTRIEWEPVGAGAEKAGPSGGWDIDLRRGEDEEWAGGYNVAQVVQWIKNLDASHEDRANPFSCAGKYHSLGPDDCWMYRGHKGEHQTRGAL